MNPAPFSDKHLIRPINPNSLPEIEQVASRMRLTLIEVLGEREGGSMYSMDRLLCLETIDPLP